MVVVAAVGAVVVEVLAFVEVVATAAVVMTAVVVVAMATTKVVTSNDAMNQ